MQSGRNAERCDKKAVDKQGSEGIDPQYMLNGVSQYTNYNIGIPNTSALQHILGLDLVGIFHCVPLGYNR